MKSKYACIKNANELRELQQKSLLAAKMAHEAYEKAKKEKVKDDVLYTLLEEYERANTHAFELSNITIERLQHSREKAVQSAAHNQWAFKSALVQNEHIENAIQCFHTWGKSLVLVKYFGIEVDTKEYTSHAAEFLDAVYTAAIDPDSSISVYEWRELYSHIVKMFAKLEISDSRFNLVLLFGLKNSKI